MKKNIFLSFLKDFYKSCDATKVTKNNRHVAYAYN